MTAAAPPETEQARDAYAALRLPDFRRYLTGNVIATLGQQMQSVAIGWELYDRTHSTLALGLVGLVQVFPIITLGLPAGQLVDRSDRRRLLILAQALLVVSSLGLALVSRSRAALILVYACLLLSGIARALQGPAKGALLPEIVPKPQYPSAATWNSGGWQLAAVLGPALGGLVIGTLQSASAVYLMDAAASLTFLVLLAMMKRAPSAEREAREVASWHSLAAGVRFVWTSKLILAALTLDMFAVLFGGATTLLPVFAKDILHVGPAGLGWLEAAPSAGAVLTALTLAHRPPMQRAGRALLWAVIGFGTATIVFGLSRSVWLSLATLAVAGAFDMVSVVIRASIVPLLTPDHLRGRVSAVNSMFVGTSNELGGFESGMVAAAIGPVACVVLGGIGTIAVVAAATFAWPEIRQMGSLEEL